MKLYYSHLKIKELVEICEKKKRPNQNTMCTKSKIKKRDGQDFAYLLISLSACKIS